MDSTAKTSSPDNKMSAEFTISICDQEGHGCDMVVTVQGKGNCHDKTDEDDKIEDVRIGNDNCSGDMRSETKDTPPKCSDSEMDDCLTTILKINNSTTQKHAMPNGHSRHEQQVSYEQYVVMETEQLSSGTTSTQTFYKCPTCDWRTKHIGFFARHMRVSHDNGRAWTCDQCAFTSTSKKQMSKHTNQHTRPFLCDYCCVRYAEHRELERHLWKHTGEFPFRCSECDYKTRFSKALKEHVRKHTGEKLQCMEPGCDFSTNYQYALTAHHAAKHTAEKRFECAACTYRTSDKGSFTKHMKLHLGVKDYKCGECEYRAVTRYDIVKHMRRHTKEKLYFCDCCDYSTSYSSGIRLHMMTHLGVKPWQCSLCHYNSVTRSKVIRHVRQRHADSPPDSSVIKLAVKLDMRGQHHKQQAPVLLPDIRLEDGPVEEVQYKLMDMPQVGDSLKVNVNTTGSDAI